MNLHRKLLVGKKKLEQQRKSHRLSPRLAPQFALILFAELRERSAGQRSIRNFTIVPGQPCLANLFFELVIRINRRQILRAPRARVKSRKHQQWIKISHANLRPQKRPPANGTACAEPSYTRFALPLKRAEELPHPFQSTIQFGFRSSIRDANVIARAEAFARNRSDVGFAQQTSRQI